VRGVANGAMDAMSGVFNRFGGGGRPDDDDSADDE
jgi:hypothetical protein